MIDIITLEKLNSLSQDEKIFELKRLRNGGTKVREIAVGLGFNNTIDYYNYLKKNKIYDSLVRDRMVTSKIIPASPSVLNYPANQSYAVNREENSFEYDSSCKTSGIDIATRLYRLAELLQKCDGDFEFSIHIKGEGI